MDTYFLNWLELIFRWLHVITGIAWIGASFYFIWLDNSLEDPPRWKIDNGVKGELWAVHGGGIYEVAKYRLGPAKMPETLHWFKWEAYSTWLTGMALLVLIFYVGADSYLIDPSISELSRAEAITYGISFILGGWLVYELLCSTAVITNGLATALCLTLIAAVTSWALTSLFSGRGAFIHLGAMIGTIMAGNVFRVIIPSQRALVEQSKQARPQSGLGSKAKLRSTHNNYFTLPLLFIMISNHYPMTYAHKHNWLVLLALVVISAFARHFLTSGTAGSEALYSSHAAFATGALAWAIIPVRTIPNTEPANAVSDMQVSALISTHCVACHATQPTDPMFSAAPGGVALETISDIRRWSIQIRAVAVDSEDMPMLNKTNMTADERQMLGQWIEKTVNG
ncbi:MAG: membrane protein [Cellvibrionales bacterium]|nr:MAG: membrane protein [Cellvibrionales bacterium]